MSYYVDFRKGPICYSYTRAYRIQIVKNTTIAYRLYAIKTALKFVIHKIFQNILRPDNAQIGKYTT